MVFTGFDGASGGVCVFICVVFVVMHGVVLMMRWLCELGCVAAALIVCIGSGVCMS